jgi:hypothetical protein
MKRLELGVLLLAAGILVYQLFLPPVVGLADEGDFAKVIGQIGLRHPSNAFDDRYYAFLTLNYRIVEPYWRSGYLTSELVPAWLARALVVVAGGGT